MLYRAVRRFCAVLLIGSGAAPALAQLPTPPTNAQSPDAAALVNAHSSAAAPYSGAVNVGIPLYTLRVGDVNLPLGIRYTSQGFKPDEAPGWLGVGWTFEGGGAVTRTVRDLPDELTYWGPPVSTSCPTLIASYPTHSPMRYAGFFWMPQWAQADQDSFAVKKLSYLANRDAIRAQNCWTASPYEAVPGLDNVLDTESDEYTFSAPGLSGKFYLRNATEACSPSGNDPDPEAGPAQACRWYALCDQHVEVELLTGTAANPGGILMAAEFVGFANANSLPLNQATRSNDTQPPRMFRGFRITTDDGTRYTFGGHPLTVDYTKSYFQQFHDYWAASAWHLTSMELPNGQLVKFGYSTGFSKQLYVSGRKIIYVDGIKNATGHTAPITPLNGAAWQNVDGMLVRQCYLRYIKEVGSGTTIVLTTGGGTNRSDYPTSHWTDITTAARGRYCPTGSNCNLTGTGGAGIGAGSGGSLTRIRVFAPPLPESTDTLGRELRRFDFAYDTGPNRRPLLTGVMEKAGTEQLPPYAFTYHPYLVNGQPSPLPEAFSGDIDHWGFFNDAGRRFPLNSGYFGGAHYGEPLHNAPDVARMGMLRSLTSPLGEYTEYDYEQHTYGWVRTRPYTTSIQLLSSAIPASMSGTAGGVRLKSVRRWERAGSMGVPRTTLYTYDHPDGGSSGVLAALPVYVLNHYRCRGVADVTGLAFILPVPPSHTYYVNLQSRQPLEALTSGVGAAIGYSFITEHYLNEGLPTGPRKQTQYSNYALNERTPSPTRLRPVDTWLDVDAMLTLNGQRSPCGPYSLRETALGKPVEETWFAAPTATDPTGRLVRQRLLDYGYPPRDDGFSHGLTGLDCIRVSNLQVNDGTPVGSVRLLEAGVYVVPTTALQLVRDRTTTYEEGSPPHVVERRYRYDLRRQVAMETTLLPEAYHLLADSVSVEYKYPSTWLGTPVMGWMRDMQLARQWRYPVEVIERRGNKIVGVSANSYETYGAFAYDMKLYPTPERTWRRLLDAPFSSSVSTQIEQNGIPVPIDEYRQLSNIERGLSGALPERFESATGPTVSRWWDVANRVVVAEVRNALAITCAFDDFEDTRAGYSSLKNWALNNNSPHTVLRFAAGAHTGRQAWRPLALPPHTCLIQRTGAPADTSHIAAGGGPGQERPNIQYWPCRPPSTNDPIPQCPDDPLLDKRQPFWGLTTSGTLQTPLSEPDADYILSFWAKRDPSPDPAAASGNFAGVWVSPYAQCSRPLAIGIDSDEWELIFVRFRFVGQYNQVLLGGNKILIDDLRLYPADARFTTLTHEPLVGTTSVIDENNTVTRYEYDAFGRQITVRDGEKRVLKTMEYHLRP